jgi:hypothetical protein
MYKFSAILVNIAAPIPGFDSLQLLASKGGRTMKLVIAATIVTLCSYVFDAWVLDLPITSMLLFLLSLPCFAIALIVCIFRKYRRTALNVMACTGVFVLGVAAVAGTLHLRDSAIRRRAAKIGDACLAYRAKYQRYPEKLDQLVPEYIPSVPPASYELFGNKKFSYAPHETTEPFIYYHCVPPFGVCYYYVESRSWSYLD